MSLVLHRISCTFAPQSFHEGIQSRKLGWYLNGSTKRGQLPLLSAAASEFTGSINTFFAPNGLSSSANTIRFQHPVKQVTFYYQYRSHRQALSHHRFSITTNSLSQSILSHHQPVSLQSCLTVSRHSVSLSISPPDPIEPHSNQPSQSPNLQSTSLFSPSERAAGFDTPASCSKATLTPASNVRLLLALSKHTLADLVT